MAADEIDDFFEEHLDLFEKRKVIPIIGPDIVNVLDNGQETNLNTYIAHRLAERLKIDHSHATSPLALNTVVCNFLKQGGVPEDVYSKIRPILKAAHFEPPRILSQLARIEWFNLYVVLSFNDLLENAINEARYQGDKMTLELGYSPHNVEDLPCPRAELKAPVVYHLFGKLSGEPDFVVTDEDTLEFLYDMPLKTREAANFFDALRDDHLLFIGCQFPDWLARFLLRITKNRQLSARRSQMEALVGPIAERDSELVTFLNHFSPRTKILRCSPIEFVTKLEARFLEHLSTPPPRGPSRTAPFEDGAIFISYAHEDFNAANRLCSFLEREAHIDTWLDNENIEGGDDWERQIQKNIRNCSYFMPLISAAATRRREAYLYKEWTWATERARGFASGAPFIIPVVIDDTSIENEVVPEPFRRAQWTHLPGGEGTAGFRCRVVGLMKDYHRRMQP